MPLVTMPKRILMTHTRAQTVSAPAQLRPVGSTFGWIGDGLSAENGGVGYGTPNPVHRLQDLFKGRVQPVPVPLLGRSGTNIKTNAGQAAWIYPFAIDAMAWQVPDFFIIGSMGHNDGILSTNPGVNPASGFTTNPFLQDWFDAVNRGYTKVATYGGYLVIVGTQSSGIGTETTIDSGQTQDRRTRVWAAQQAHVETMMAADSRVKFVSLADMIPPTNWSIDVAGSFTHGDERYGYEVASRVFAVLDPLIDSVTLDQVSDMIDNGTYPFMTGPNQDSDKNLAGTGGPVTGPGVTGSIATTKEIVNSTGAVGNTVAQQATSAGRTKTHVDFAGTTTVASRVYIRDSANLTIAATPGKIVRTGARFRASAGFRNFGSEWGSFGAWGGGATNLTNNNMSGADETHALDTLIFNAYGGRGTFGSAYVGRRGVALSFPSGKDLTGLWMEFERPFWYIPSNRLAAAPFCIGTLVDGLGAAFLGQNYRPRVTGTISQASGGTLRFEPGLWNLFGLTETDFFLRKAYLGTISDTTVGSGTEIASVTGSVWTAAIAGGVGTTGDKIWADFGCNNGLGSVVVRCLVADVLTVT